MTHAAHVPADFVSTFRHRLAPLFGRKIGRQRSEQYLKGNPSNTQKPDEDDKKPSPSPSPSPDPEGRQP
jgi:hypothetical protein